MSKYSIGSTKVKEHLSSTDFKSFFATHDTLPDNIVTSLFRDSIKYLCNRDDKNIKSIAVCMMVVNLIESDKNSIDTIACDPLSLESSQIIVDHARSIKKAVLSIENSSHKKSTFAEYLCVVKRLVVEYFLSKSERVYTDKLISSLRRLEVRISTNQEYIPWRYIDTDKIVTNLNIDDMDQADDVLNDTESKDRLEKVAKILIERGLVSKAKTLLNTDFNP